MAKYTALRSLYRTAVREPYSTQEILVHDREAHWLQTTWQDGWI